MLNPEFKKKWVEALRSGKYKQAQGALHYKSRNTCDTYCCLGVACNVLGINYGYEELSREIGINDFEPFINLNDSRTYFDTKTQQIVDNGSKSFEYIAKYIEENY